MTDATAGLPTITVKPERIFNQWELFGVGCLSKYRRIFAAFQIRFHWLHWSRQIKLDTACKTICCANAAVNRIRIHQRVDREQQRPAPNARTKIKIDNWQFDWQFGSARWLLSVLCVCRGFVYCVFFTLRSISHQKRESRKVHISPSAFKCNVVWSHGEYTANHRFQSHLWCTPPPANSLRFQFVIWNSNKLYGERLTSRKRRKRNQNIYRRAASSRIESTVRACVCDCFSLEWGAVRHRRSRQIVCMWACVALALDLFQFIIIIIILLRSTKKVLFFQISVRFVC